MVGLPLPRWLGVGAVLVLVLALSAGFLLDGRGFAGNVLAETAGLISAILVAALVVDRYVAADRAQRWNLVSSETLETLRFAVVKMAHRLYLTLPAPRPPNADPIAMDAAGKLTIALEALSAALRTAADGLTPQRDDIHDVANEVRANSRVIREVILPRLLLIGAEPDLARPIVELESSLENLDQDIFMGQRLGFPAPSQFQSFASIVDGLLAVARRLG